MPAAFLAGMYAAERFNANRVVSSVTNLLGVFQQNTTPEVKVFCLLKSMKLIGSLDPRDHEYLIPDVGPVLV